MAFSGDGRGLTFECPVKKKVSPLLYIVHVPVQSGPVSHLFMPYPDVPPLARDSSRQGASQPRLRLAFSYLQSSPSQYHDMTSSLQ